MLILTTPLGVDERNYLINEKIAHDRIVCAKDINEPLNSTTYSSACVVHIVYIHILCNYYVYMSNV